MIGQTEGTFFIDANFTNSIGDQTIFISTGRTDINDYIFIQMNPASLLETGVVVNNIEIARIGIEKPTGRYKCAIAYADNRFVFYVNGVLVGSDLSGSMSGFSADYINLNFNNNAYSLGALQVFNTVLTDAELTILTTI